MNMKQSCKALICAIEGELYGRHCTEEQAAAILDHALPSLTETLARVRSELLEAVRMLREIESTKIIFNAEKFELNRRLVAFLDQAEQQEAQGAQAGEFQREDRYIVIKRKDLEKAPTLMAYALQVALDGLREHLPERECLVIEGDWPEFEPTWAAIQARVEGRAALATQPAERECNCPKIGERFSAEKHGGPCPVHDAVRGAEHE